MSDSVASTRWSTPPRLPIAARFSTPPSCGTESSTSTCAALLPHSGERADHAGGRRSRARSSTSQRCRPMAVSLYHRLLRVEGRAATLTTNVAIRCSIPDPGQRTQHRLDGRPRRGPHHEYLSRRQGRLEGRRRSRSRSAGSSTRRWRGPLPSCAPTRSGLMTGSIIDFDQNVVGDRPIRRSNPLSLGFAHGA